MKQVATSVEQRSWLSRIGSVCAIVGALGAAVGNLLHPVTPRDDPVGVARVIAESDAWTLIHVVIVIGLILMFLGLVAIGHSIAGGVAEALARLGVYAAAVGTALGVATVILDGVGAKQLADQWAEAPGATKALALSLVSTNETLNFALAGMFNLSFAGVPFILLGLAVALDSVYPRWLGVARGVRWSGLRCSWARSSVHGQAHRRFPHPDHHRADDHLALGARDGRADGPSGSLPLIGRTPGTSTRSCRPFVSDMGCERSVGAERHGHTDERDHLPDSRERMPEGEAVQEPFHRGQVARSAP